ncbi:protein FAR-RED IMPAIRED RESPONSE 1-like [Camellia sinensis]|uniref:protein FAR-RED IMPAIRED RESPONSE 1-like n=1 Tax=Camellia sinensis TaxID=4442 RepID=UPI001035B560|nr:protein FAR-RED IMPAIRED RESPONSE 1-like [Camellia sinensis]
MAMRNVSVKTSQIMNYMVNQSGFYENVGFIRTDLHNHIQAERRAEVEDGDVQGALVYLCTKLDVDARFFYKYDVCNDNKFQNLFWADSKSRADYTKFANGTIETCTWVLETFMEAMGHKAPVSVLTDGDKTMRECMDMETDETKFEHGWMTMVEKFGLQTNSWVLETYKKRHMWAEAYMRGHLFAGMKGTQRSECMNAYFNPFLQHKLKLNESVRHYDRALERIRYNEAGDDAETNNSFPPVGQYGSVEAAVCKDDSTTIDEVNQVDGKIQYLAEFDDSKSGAVTVSGQVLWFSGPVCKDCGCV